jgi:hypothetical protein
MVIFVRGRDDVCGSKTYLGSMSQEPGAPPAKILPPAAIRALEEAAARRALESACETPIEHGGPKGPEPTRYGDWEKKGLAVDF